jgi:outer membrane protein TolC
MRGAASMLLLVCLAAPAAVAGPEPPVVETDGHDHPELAVDPALTLAETVRLAADREPGVRVVGARAEEAEALRGDAGRWLADAPAIVVGHVTDAVGRDAGYRQWDAVLELPLWWPGQRGPRREKALAADAAAEGADLAHRLEVAGRVRASLASLSLARNRLELARAELEAEEALSDRVARAVELGELAERDLLLARSASLERRTLYLEALEEHRHAEADYFLLTGLRHRPAEWGETLASDAGLPDHPALRLARDDVAIAQAEVERLEGSRWGSPVLAIGSQHERDIGSTDYSNRLAAGLRIPLGRRDQTVSGVAQARRALAEARRDAERLEIELRGRLLRAEHGLALVDERLATAVRQSRMAGDYLRLTERGFALGEIDLATLIRARAWASGAERTLREAEILQRFRIAEYNQALGVVP